MAKKQEAPASDRVVTSTDNNPPEAITLPVAADVAARQKEAAEALRDKHLETFLTYRRVPAVIEDRDVYDRVTTLSVMVKQAFDAIDKARSAAKKPYLDGGTAVDKAYALPVEVDLDPFAQADDGDDTPREKVTVNMLAELKGAHESLKKRLSAYDTEEYKKAEALRIAEQTGIAAAAAEDGIVMDVAQVGAGKMQSSRSGHGGIAIKNVEKTFTVVDASKVPASLCSPDPVKIQAAIDAGANEIAGIEIDVQVKTHVR
jgi:hypothetical protein